MDLLLHPFTLGLILGLIFALLALYRFFTLKHEFSRYKRHLSDKLEVEAEMLSKHKTDKEKIRQENEHLRMQVKSFNQPADRRASRDLEVFARAEKKLMVSVPGFAAAWENAKSEAQSEVEAEEQGKSLPKKVFTKLFGSSNKREIAGPQEEPDDKYRLGDGDKH